MKLLEVKEFDDLFDTPNIKSYDVVVTRTNLSPGSMIEGKTLHVSVNSESPALGALKSVDRYLKEEIGLTPKTFELSILGKLEFEFCKYRDLYRVYGVMVPKGGFMNVGMSASEYVIQIENCSFGRMLVGDDVSRNEASKAMEIAEEESKKYNGNLEFLFNPNQLDTPYTIRIRKRGKVVFERKIKSSELESYQLKRNVKEIIVRGPVMGLSGEQKLVNDLIEYLETSPFEKVRTYYEYPLTKDEKKELERLRDKELGEYNESLLKLFLIANELGWMGSSRIDEVRKDYLELLKNKKSI